ncbi:MAG: enoyl-CoA hydratase/isomerase family protein [Holophagaceae bacterium]|nr:enoyl-CoA hydratase/isomerase family protein [Holophagaceae bacterium]
MKPERVFHGSTSLDLRRGGEWAWIGLASEDSLNRLRMDLLEALDLLFVHLRWSGVRRICLSDAGWMNGIGANFCAGADLHEVAMLHGATVDAFARRGQRVMEHLAWPGWHSLTLISGAAMGGGCDLALSGQERWGVDVGGGEASAFGRRAFQLAHPAAMHGILTGFGGTVRLVEVLGEAGADRLFQGMERWDAAQAMEAGAIQRRLRPEDARGAVERHLRVGLAAHPHGR